MVVNLLDVVLKPAFSSFKRLSLLSANKAHLFAVLFQFLLLVAQVRESVDNNTSDQVGEQHKHNENIHKVEETLLVVLPLVEVKFLLQLVTGEAGRGLF